MHFQTTAFLATLPLIVCSEQYHYSKREYDVDRLLARELYWLRARQAYADDVELQVAFRREIEDGEQRIDRPAQLLKRTKTKAEEVEEVTKCLGYMYYGEQNPCKYITPKPGAPPATKNMQCPKCARDSLKAHSSHATKRRTAERAAARGAAAREAAAREAAAREAAAREAAAKEERPITPKPTNAEVTPGLRPDANEAELLLGVSHVGNPDRFGLPTKVFKVSGKTGEILDQVVENPDIHNPGFQR